MINTVFFKRFTYCFFLFISLNINLTSQKKFIVVDQFGYRPNAKKIAVIRSAEVGYDSADKYTPGSNFAVVNALTGSEVFTGSATSWKNGAVHDQSGDKAWWFDFSSLNKDGEYYILDKTTNEKSYNFKINKDVYKDVFKAAFKTFYYQRAGYEKKAQWAEAAWADGASHIKPGQDKNARPFNDKLNAAKEKDLSGGWYDAGDYNKYTPWHSDYIVNFLVMYLENKAVWTDDFNIPESGNGVPDIIDEVVFGLDWLKKMQLDNGSALSVLGLASASPPSAATGPSYYGNPSTFASSRSAEAFAFSAYVLKDFPKYADQVPDLINRAKAAFKWSIDNPKVESPNNSSSNGTSGLAAGNQETNDLGRETSKLRAAYYLYLATNDASYKTYFESNFNKMPLVAWGNYISQYFMDQQDILIQYTSLKDRNETIANQIKNATLTAANKSDDFAGAVNDNKDPYRAFTKDFNWGSNQYKGAYGNFFTSLAGSGFDNSNKSKYLEAAEGYLNYIHGVNPLNIVYVTATKRIGADNTITQFYHSWFNHNTKWDVEGSSQFGPAPGFLVGGPNPKYTKDGCCPSSCGSTNNNALCNINVSTLIGQPPMKSYKDFNDGWPANSWAISENSNGYQINYIRLLSKFIGDATSTAVNDLNPELFKVYPNPASDEVTLEIANDDSYDCNILTIDGKLIHQSKIKGTDTISLNKMTSGQYIIQLKESNKIVSVRSLIVNKN
jgi:endoglucanase